MKRFDWANPESYYTDSNEEEEKAQRAPTKASVQMGNRNRPTNFLPDYQPRDVSGVMGSVRNMTIHSSRDQQQRAQRAPVTQSGSSNQPSGSQRGHQQERLYGGGNRRSFAPQFNSRQSKRPRMQTVLTAGNTSAFMSDEGQPKQLQYTIAQLNGNPVLISEWAIAGEEDGEGPALLEMSPDFTTLNGQPFNARHELTHLQSLLVSSVAPTRINGITKQKLVGRISQWIVNGMLRAAAYAIAVESGAPRMRLQSIVTVNFLSTGVNGRERCKVTGRYVEDGMWLREGIVRPFFPADAQPKRDEFIDLTVTLLPLNALLASKATNARGEETPLHHAFVLPEHANTDGLADRLEMTINERRDCVVPIRAEPLQQDVSRWLRSGRASRANGAADEAQRAAIIKEELVWHQEVMLAVCASGRAKMLLVMDNAAAYGTVQFIMQNDERTVEVILELEALPAEGAENKVAAQNFCFKKEAAVVFRVPSYNNSPNQSIMLAIDEIVMDRGRIVELHGCTSMIEVQDLEESFGGPYDYDARPRMGIELSPDTNNTGYETQLESLKRGDLAKLAAIDNVSAEMARRQLGMGPAVDDLRIQLKDDRRAAQMLMEGFNLNAEQAQVILELDKDLATELIVAAFAGTGKTYLIAIIINRLMERLRRSNETAIVMAHTNEATINCIEAIDRNIGRGRNRILILQSLHAEPSVLRNRPNSEWRNYRMAVWANALLSERSRASIKRAKWAEEDIEFAMRYVERRLNHGAGRPYFEEKMLGLLLQAMKFDVVVTTTEMAHKWAAKLAANNCKIAYQLCDEGGMLTEMENVLLGLQFSQLRFSAKFGDPMQLGPYIHSGSEPLREFGLESALVTSLRRRATRRLELVETFRFHPAFLNVLSPSIYGGRMTTRVHHASKAAVTSTILNQLLPTPNVPMMVVNCTTADRVLESKSRDNAAMEELCELLYNTLRERAGLRANHIDALCYYAGTSLALEERLGVPGRTIETYQGRENKGIIAATTRLDVNEPHKAAFAKNPNRFATMVTRAQDAFFLIMPVEAMMNESPIITSFMTEYAKLAPIMSPDFVHEMASDRWRDLAIIPRTSHQPDGYVGPVLQTMVPARVEHRRFFAQVELNQRWERAEPDYFPNPIQAPPPPAPRPTPANYADAMRDILHGAAITQQVEQQSTSAASTSARPTVTMSIAAAKRKESLPEFDPAHDRLLDTPSDGEAVEMDVDKKTEEAPRGGPMDIEQTAGEEQQLQQLTGVQVQANVIDTFSVSINREMEDNNDEDEDEGRPSIDERLRQIRAAKINSAPAAGLMEEEEEEAAESRPFEEVKKKKKVRKSPKKSH